VPLRLQLGLVLQLLDLHRRSLRGLRPPALQKHLIRQPVVFHLRLRLFTLGILRPDRHVLELLLQPPADLLDRI